MNRWKAWCKKMLTKENMIVLALSGILLMIIAMPTEKKKAEESGTESVLTDNKTAMMGTEGQESSLPEETVLEQKLARFLSCMEGTGEVKVMLTFSSSAEQVVEKDSPASHAQTEEKDSAGGSRSTKSREQQEETVYTTDAAGNRIPYVRQTYAPQVEGVTVLAQGGDSPVVQRSITDVIEALFGIAPHKIKVAKMGTEP